MSESRAETIAVAIATVLVVAVVMAGIVAWVVAVQKSNVGRVEACTSNGGSWVAGPLGFECRQGVPGGVDPR